MSGGGAESEGDTESEAGSRLWAVSTEPDAGLELTDREIMTWAEVGHPNGWATHVPLRSDTCCQATLWRYHPPLFHFHVIIKTHRSVVCWLQYKCDHRIYSADGFFYPTLWHGGFSMSVSFFVSRLTWFPLTDMDYVIMRMRHILSNHFQWMDI